MAAKNCRESFNHEDHEKVKKALYLSLLLVGVVVFIICACFFGRNYLNRFYFILHIINISWLRGIKTPRTSIRTDRRVKAVPY